MKKNILKIILPAIFLFLILGNFSFAALEIPETGLPKSEDGIASILSNFLSWLLGIFGIIAIVSFVISGIQYFMSAGDEKKIMTAKRNMTYSIIGVIVALASFVVIQAIDKALNATESSF